MVDDYTPTTDAVRAAYVRNRRRPFTDPEDHRAEFQRWLEAHDAALRAEWEAEQGETEWEYGERSPSSKYVWGPWTAEKADSLDIPPDLLVRRRAPGPWVPINENGETP